MPVGGIPTEEYFGLTEKVLGAGKTIITSAVIDELLRMDAALAYFYCDFQQARSTNATEIIRSLLAQLLGKSKKKWLSSFPELCKRKAHDLGPPSDNRLLCDWLLSASKLHNRPVIVIDALDECMDQELDDLLDVIPRLNVGHLRVFLSSRPEQIIKDAFVGLPSLSLQERSAFLAKDIRIYITKELQTRRRLRNLPAQLREEIRSVLPPKANGMFRWVQCQLDSLSRCITAAQIRQVLESLPKGLNETYDRILLAIHEKEFHGPFVRRTLTWLVVALEPLHIQQILEAVKIEIGKSIIDDDTGPMNHMMLIDACSSLVNFDEQTQMLSLSHFSVKVGM
ncbi:hypothetical protein ID866_7013 [Astraeus odoratus]|nr:hypothetical protein ID866_7013 [Astraeus odoratus]